VPKENGSAEVMMPIDDQLKMQILLGDFDRGATSGHHGRRRRNGSGGAFAIAASVVVVVVLSVIAAL